MIPPRNRKTKPNPLEELLKPLLAFKGLLLLFGSFVYLVGFFVWSVAALKIGLGLLPIVQVQYFAAGFPPAVAILAAWSIFELTRKSTSRWRNIQTQLVLAARAAVCFLAPTMMITFLLLPVASRWPILGSWLSAIIVALAVGGCLWVRVDVGRYITVASIVLR